MRQRRQGAERSSFGRPGGCPRCHSSASALVANVLRIFLASCLGVDGRLPGARATFRPCSGCRAVGVFRSRPSAVTSSRRRGVPCGLHGRLTLLCHAPGRVNGAGALCSCSHPIASLWRPRCPRNSLGPPYRIHPTVHRLLFVVCLWWPMLRRTSHHPVASTYELQDRFVAVFRFLVFFSEHTGPRRGRFHEVFIATADI